jgi:hypothetical protein
MNARKENMDFNRQGDPVSRMLFLLFMEALNAALHRPWSALSASLPRRAVPDFHVRR